MRRHRTLVTSAVAVLAFGLAVLAGFATVLAGKNRELDVKNTELAGKNEELDRQRQRAERREAMAIEAVKKFRDAVQSNAELKNRPELDALRKVLLAEPLEFFGKLKDELQSDRDTRPDALAKLAGAGRDLAITTEEIGRVPDADPLVHRVDRHPRAARPRPARGRSRTGAAWPRATTDSAALLRRDGPAGRGDGIVPPRAGDPRGRWRETIPPTSAIPAPAGPTPAAASAPAARHGPAGRGDGVLSRGDARSASGLAREHPDVAGYRNELAGSAQQHRACCLGDGPARRGAGVYRRALEIRERLAREHPKSPSTRPSLAGSHHNIGLLLTELDRPAEALESFRRELAIRERLALEEPSVTEYQSDLAHALNGTGYMLDVMGRKAEALRIAPSGAGDPRAAGRRQSRRHRAPQRPGPQPHQHRQPARRDGPSGPRRWRPIGRAQATLEQLVRENPAVPAYRIALGAVTSTKWPPSRWNWATGNRRGSGWCRRSLATDRPWRPCPTTRGTWPA